MFLLGLLSVGGPVSALEVGEPAPDFALPSTTGETVSLSQYKGNKPVLLEFYISDTGAT